MNKTKLKLLLIANYLNNFGWALYSPLYALFVLHLGGTKAEVSFIWAGYALLTGILIILFGRLENSVKYSPGIMLIVGYFLFVIVALSYLVIKTIPQLIVAQIILALAMGVLTPAAKSTYMKAEERGKEAGEWGLFDGGNYLIGAGAAFMGGILLRIGNFRLIFITMALIQLVSTAYAYMHWQIGRRKTNSSFH